MLFGLSQRAGLFWLLVVVAAAGVLVSSWVLVTPELSLAPAALFFAVACGIAERVQVRLSSSRPGSEILYSVSCAVLVAVILLFPLAWAALIAAVGFAIGGALRGQRQPLKLLYNIANFTLSAAVGSLVWNAGGREIGLASALSIPWIALAAIVYFVTNSGLTAAMVAFVLDLPIRLVWQRSHGNMLVANVALL